MAFLSLIHAHLKFWNFRRGFIILSEWGATGVLYHWAHALDILKKTWQMFSGHPELNPRRQGRKLKLFPLCCPHNETAQLIKEEGFGFHFWVLEKLEWVWNESGPWVNVCFKLSEVFSFSIQLLSQKLFSLFAFRTSWSGVDIIIKVLGQIRCLYVSKC